jgi:hypothetical protein
MYCDNCGKEHPDTAMFCDDCGTELSGDGAGEAGEADQPTAGTQGSQPTQGGQGNHQQGQYNQGAQGGQGGYQQGGQGGYQQGGQGGYQQGSNQYNQGGQYGGGAPQDTGSGLTVRTEADKYLKKFATYNLALGCLTAFFGLLALVFSLFAGGMMMQSAAPPEMSGVFGAAMTAIAVFIIVIAGLYFATWHFAKKRSAIAVYGMTGLLAIGTVLNAVTLNIIGFPISLLGAYWGYKSFDAV